MPKEKILIPVCTQTWVYKKDDQGYLLQNDMEYSRTTCISNRKVSQSQYYNVVDDNVVDAVMGKSLQFNWNSPPPYLEIEWEKKDPTSLMIDKKRHKVSRYTCMLWMDIEIEA